jgi:hypothetical protein
MAVDPYDLAIAMVYSLLLIVIIIGCANLIYWFGKKRAMKRSEAKVPGWEDYIVPPKHFILLRVLLDEKGHASLSLFQFLLWTLLISFLYVTLWFLQLGAGSTQAPLPIQAGLMVLMGISVAVPIASKGISEYKKFKERDEGEIYEEPSYSSMLEEQGRPSLLRLQMFIWTLAALVIYVWLFITTVFSAAPDAIPGLPDIDPTLLFLMGLSQAGYLGGQAYSGSVIKGEQPEKKNTSEEPAHLAKEAPGTASVHPSPFVKDIIVDATGLVTLLGSGFGKQKETIIIDEDRVPDDAIMRWEEMRIDFTMPQTASRGTKHSLRVVIGGVTANGLIPVTGQQGTGRFREIDATLLGDLWIDNPNEKGYKVPPIGYFIPEKRYFFCFEFDVPPGTPQWGGPQFRAKFFLDGELIDTRSFLPGAGSGKNYGNFDYVFPAEGKHNIEISGVNAKSMDIEVKKPPVG